MSAEGHGVEARLRTALAARADQVDRQVRDPGPVEARPPVRRSLWRAHPTAVTALAVAAAVALVFGVIVLRNDEQREQQVASDLTSTSATSAPGVSVAPGSSVVIPVSPPPTTPGATVVPPSGSATITPQRPTTTKAQVDRSITGWPARGSTQHKTARDAAAAFVRSVLGFAEPTFKRSTGEDAPVGGLAQITFSSRPTAGAETTIVVVRNGERSWLVRGATSNQGSIATATFSKGRIDVTGSGAAFEATITVRALALNGTELGEDITMGGAGPEQAPYSGSVRYASGDAAFVLVGGGDASGDGDLIWACVRLDEALG